MQVSVERHQSLFSAITSTRLKNRGVAHLEGPDTEGCQAMFNRCVASVWDDKILTMDSVDVVQSVGWLI